MVVENYIIVALLAMAPISESRGAIIFGLGMGLNSVFVLILAILANILLIPVAFFFLRQAKVRDFFFKMFKKTADKHIEKNEQKFSLLKELALFGFVAVPFPFTGVASAALISEILGWDQKKSTIAITAGIVVASIVVWAGTLGIIRLFL